MVVCQRRHCFCADFVGRRGDFGDFLVCWFVADYCLAYWFIVAFWVKILNTHLNSLMPIILLNYQAYPTALAFQAINRQFEQVVRCTGWQV